MPNSIDVKQYSRQTTTTGLLRLIYPVKYEYNGAWWDLDELLDITRSPFPTIIHHNRASSGGGGGDIRDIRVRRKEGGIGRATNRGKETGKNGDAAGGLLET